LVGAVVDNPGLSWTTYDPSPAGGWVGQESTSYYGQDSARSGPITHSQNSFLEATVDGPGTLSFYWKVSSELNHDYLEFYIDGAMQDRISGVPFVSRWYPRTYLVGSGSHLIRRSVPCRRTAFSKIRRSPS